MSTFLNSSSFDHIVLFPGTENSSIRRWSSFTASSSAMPSAIFRSSQSYTGLRFSNARLKPRDFPAPRACAERQEWRGDFPHPVRFCGPYLCSRSFRAAPPLRPRRYSSFIAWIDVGASKSVVTTANGGSCSTSEGGHVDGSETTSRWPIKGWTSDDVAAVAPRLGVEGVVAGFGGVALGALGVLGARGARGVLGATAFRADSPEPQIRWCISATCRRGVSTKRLAVGCRSGTPSPPTTPFRCRRDMTELRTSRAKFAHFSSPRCCASEAVACNCSTPSFFISSSSLFWKVLKPYESSLNGMTE
mmetsp:Transcript_8743/g.36190  ORF Transcript_8743/g.36190 Transcript_8743/m.36190 type:complete len:304 (+) Transcript_8743:460-1371(+)